jgi:hypothetical protein
MLYSETTTVCSENESLLRYNSDLFIAEHAERRANVWLAL